MSTLQPDGELLTVEEVAEQLGKSVATIRRWCVEGKITAQKQGRKWIIRRSDVTSKLTSMPRRARPKARFDVVSAILHVRRTDLNELWVPDVLRWADFLEDSSGLAKRAKARLDNTQSFDAATDIEVPKTPFFSRKATALTIEDHVAYQAAVSAIAHAVEGGLSRVVFSARLTEAQRYFLEKGTKAWMRFKTHVKEQVAKGLPWVIKTDVTAYFDSIQHSILFQDLAALGVASTPIEAIRRALNTWMPVRGLGIPQGPNASRVLGNLYMAPVDRAMANRSWSYARYQDDIRIMASSRHDAFTAFRQLEKECRNRGLSLSSSKTALLEGDEAVRKDFGDQELDLVAYNLSIRRYDLARAQLKSIIRKSIQGSGKVNVRRGRFSLWRLTQLRDDAEVHRILNNLQYLGPIAALAASYLRPWMRRRRVQEKLAEYLNDSERNVFRVTSAWLLAGMLDYRAPLPTEWVDYARGICQDRNEPSYHRAVAASVMSRSHSRRDHEWLEAELVRESDPEVLRGFLVALARAGSLHPKGAAKQSLERQPRLMETFTYLQGRNTLPSLLYSGQVVDIPSR